MSKVSKDQYIKDLEHDMGTLTDMVIKLKEENKNLKIKLKYHEKQKIYNKTGMEFNETN